MAIPANPDALALGLKSGADAKSDLQETLELLRGLMGAVPQSEETLPHFSAYKDQWLEVARELRRLMQKA